MFEDTVDEPALAASEHQFELSWHGAALLQRKKGVHQAIQVLARFDDTDGQHEWRIADSNLLARPTQECLVSDGHEARFDAARDDGDGRRLNPEEHHQVVARIFGVGHDEIRPLHRSWHHPFQIHAQPFVGAIRTHQKSQVVHRKDAARMPQRGQDEVGRVVQVDWAAQPIGRQRQFGAVPRDRKPPLPDANLVARKVARQREFRHATTIGPGIDQAILVVVVDHMLTLISIKTSFIVYTLLSVNHYKKYGDI